MVGQQACRVRPDPRSRQRDHSGSAVPRSRRRDRRFGHRELRRTGLGHCEVRLMASDRNSTPRIRCAILGSGNIGTDLMAKLMRSQVLELRAMAGIEPASAGLARARGGGSTTCDNGIGGLLALDPRPQIVFDATSAHAHREHASRLREAKIIAIDLTPAAVGDYVVPTVNLEARLNATNLNLVTCGGQATIPIVAAVNRVAPVEYAETVAKIASASA